MVLTLGANFQVFLERDAIQ
ncbi:hypothetical protein D018_0630A, partial [Vibrio parahaemolyticus VP2007-007]